MTLAAGRLEVGDRGCAMDERRGVAMPCVVVSVFDEGRAARVQFELDERMKFVTRDEFLFETWSGKVTL